MKKSNIDWAKQIEGVNCVEVVYKSGVTRYVGLGDGYYRFTGTQRDFMENAEVVDLRDGTRYWITKDSNPRLVEYLNRNLANVPF